jgi:membrane protein insertase Oxa1/YidC/SpoIIIJ
MRRSLANQVCRRWVAPQLTLLHPFQQRHCSSSSLVSLPEGTELDDPKGGLKESLFGLIDTGEMGETVPGPIGMMVHTLTSLHDTTGMPWWSTILLSSVVLRVVFFPIQLIHHQNAQ